MITLSPADAVQHPDLSPWLEAHGVKATTVYELVLRPDVKIMTVRAYVEGQDGQFQMRDGELVRQSYEVNIGLPLLPWMAPPVEVSAEQSDVKPDGKKGRHHA